MLGQILRPLIRTLFIFLLFFLIYFYFVFICTIEYFIKIQGLPYGVSLSLAPCIFLKSSIRRNCKGDKLILDKVSRLAITMEETSMNADEMMYELGFEKLENHCNEVEVVYQRITETEIWRVFFFKSYGLGYVNYSVSHYHWFENLVEWKNMDPYVDMELHKAIHQVLIEHGWL